MTSLADRLKQHGPVFNRLTVIEGSLWRDKNRQLYCKCQCTCTNIVDVQVSDLLRGFTKSCKCLQREANTTHGLTKHPLYDTWNNKKQLCNNPKYKDYPFYGGRGIKICDAWSNDPAPFITYVLCTLGPRPRGMSLDRINNAGNYEPGNLHWATYSEQILNQRPRKSTKNIPTTKELLGIIDAPSENRIENTPVNCHDVAFSSVPRRICSEGLLK